jgi:hypothetical protein
VKAAILFPDKNCVEAIFICRVRQKRGANRTFSKYCGFPRNVEVAPFQFSIKIMAIFIESNST